MKGIHKALRRRKRNAGAAAIELAAVLPLMLLFLMGTIDIVDMYMEERRMLRATSNMADLIARQNEMDSDKLDDIAAASQTVFRPLGGAPASFGVSEVRFDDDGDASVGWTASVEGGTVNDPVAETSGIDLRSSSVIVVEGRFTWTPQFLSGLIGDVRLSETAVARPRVVNRIPFR